MRYRLDREHVAAIAWLDKAPGDANPLASLEAALDEVGAGLGADGTLTHPLGLLAVEVWFGSSAGFERAALEQLAFDPRSSPGVRIALGEPAAGLEGFRRTHDEATETRRVMTLANRPPGTLTRYSRGSRKR